MMKHGSWLIVIGLGALGCPGDDGAPSNGEGSTESGSAEGGSATASNTNAASDTAEPASTGPGSEPTSDSSSTGGAPSGTCDEAELSELYTQYVEPFVSGAMPSSCSECHMTGINISLYAQDTPCATMACMVDAGQVDLDDPGNSALLQMIQQGNPESAVFDIEDEYDAMKEWIEWSAGCHAEVCGAVHNACKTGTGAGSTGVNPIGDCSEDDLLISFWDNVIVDKGRCALCHSESAKEEGTFGPCPCPNENQLCVDGTCYAPGPLLAPSTFHGEGMLNINDPDDEQDGLNTLYDMVALGHLDESSPLDSQMLTKPLLEDFQPSEIYGDGVAVTDIGQGEGVGTAHEGTSKFNFGCHMSPCGFEMDAPVDCRVDRPCGGDGGGCDDGYTCVLDEQFEARYCRLSGSVCDHTYVNYVKFAQYFAQCK